MAAPRPLQRTSTVDALADALRREILDGELPAGHRLRERELCETYGVARHSLRAALRALAADGLVRIEPHRGAHVDRSSAATTCAGCTSCAPRSSWRPRTSRSSATAGACRRPCTRRSRGCSAACAGDDPPWSAINEAHAELHGAIVAAAASPRIAAAHAALSGEMRLFLLALKPHVPADRLAADHAALIRGLERDGPSVLREHLRAAAATLVDAEGDRPGG